MSSINHQLIKQTLKEWSDQALQTRLWLSSGAFEVSSFIEAAEQLFDDSGLDTALHSGTTGFGAKVDAMLRQLEQEIESIDGQRKPQEIINDVKMRRIRRLAADALILIGEQRDFGNAHI